MKSDQITKTKVRGERGSTMAEFAIVAVVFFMIIFAILEFGRLLYTHNALTDAARRGARYAALHEDTKSLCVKEVVVFGEENVDAVNNCALIGSPLPLINGLDINKVTVTYIGADSDNDPNTPPTAYGMNLGTATVTIHDYTFNLSIPFARQTLNMGAYTSTLTAESAGTEPSPIPSP